ncbi:Zn-dependent hydrolase [Bacillus sp. JJ1764]|uniref:Zn-dependent hydrolase n=1 Tax=Bacillus sp. JJ1764 TaxID=3122964 RepID=UPI002FFE7592
MQTMMLGVNRQRLLKTIEVSASIGATENGGLNRLALTQEDQQMRDRLVEWMGQAGLEVGIDDFGNIYGRRKGKLKDGPVVAVGSHLDTQPCGGRFDGILGVLSALEAIRVLNEQQLETDYPIEIINFTNEEGARFTPPMLGSGGVAGVFTKEFIYNIKDNNQVSYENALQKINYLGERKHRLKNVKNYLELHVEQGPILEKERKTIGIVEGIQGMSWLTVTVTGETNHAGPTPMEHRRDALVPTAKMISKLHELTKEIDGLKITVGRLDVKPNIANVIPGQVEFTIDIRHKDNDIRSNAIESLKEQLSTIALLNNVDVMITVNWDSDAIEFSSEVMDAVAEACENRGYSAMRLFSGPGHDAKYISKMAPSGMIFVPSVKGISHNENELTLEDDIEKGANVLLHVLYKLSMKK